MQVKLMDMNMLMMEEMVQKFYLKKERMEISNIQPMIFINPLLKSKEKMGLLDKTRIVKGINYSTYITNQHYKKVH